MSKRLLLAGLLGGVAMFVWSSVAHNFLPLGDTGIREIPNETGVLSAMHDSIGNSSGLYLFPGIGAGPNATAQQKREVMQHYQAKLDSNPSGLLIYHPPGQRFLSPHLLITEFALEVIESLLAVFLLSLTRLTSFGSKVGFITLLGVVAAITTNIPYWNWYGFPTSYTVAYMFTEVVAYFVVGVVAALMLRGTVQQSRFAAA